MKLLSVTIPCFNSSAYMEKCIESLLIGGEDVEILIVDDGSEKDDTAQIADRYEQQYPTIVKAIHKKNGGHGSAVNTGIAYATGLFFKVVDSDDWVKAEAYLTILATLRQLIYEGKVPDAVFSNFVYEKTGEKKKKLMHYKGMFPTDTIFGWEDCKHFPKGHYLLMHAVIFRTEVLRKANLCLPEHTFYVDNLYVFEPLPYVKKLYYIDVNFYRYFIGREDQSVNEQVMISRIDQQLRVNYRMIDYLTDLPVNRQQNRQLYNYMRNYLEIITTVSSVMLIRSGTEENLQKKKQLWEYLKKKDHKLYFWMRHGIMGSTMNLPGRGGRHLSVDAYHICQKIFKFN